MILTPRLILRPPAEADRDALARINGDPQVGAWLGGALDRARSDALIDRVSACIAQHGYGFWTAETRDAGEVIGLIGLTPILEDSDLPLAPGIEIGWRLSPRAWGQGYAAEGAAAALAWGLTELGAAEIVSFTARINVRSQAVMRRIGLRPDPSRDFDHPRLAAADPLRPHVVFSTAG